MRAALIALTLAAISVVPVSALAPPLPCEGIEANMVTGELYIFGPDNVSTGVVVERYFNATELRDNVYVSRPAPVPHLVEFYGVRVTYCPTGQFLAIDAQSPAEVDAALSATEFLRPRLQAGQPVRFDDLRRAANAVYGGAIVLRETEETCGCNMFFPEVRPQGMRSFQDRTDVEY